MKNKTVYYLSILLVGVFIFIYSRNQQVRQVDLENNTDALLNTNIIPSETSSDNKPPLNTTNKFNIEELTGDYWNHLYIREDPKLSDVSLNLSYNEQNQLEAQFLYYELMDNLDSNGEEWGVQRDGGVTTLTPLSDSVLIVDDPLEFLPSDFIYIIKTANQIGLSFDGKKIDYYKYQHIIPKLSDRILIKHFYGKEFLEEPSNIEGHTVKVGKIEHFQELDKEYALVFFEEYFSELYGLRSGGNSSYLSVAKLRKEATGMRILSFSSYCSCGHHTNGPAGANGDSFIAYPNLQKIGNKHFLLRKKIVLEESLEKVILQVYDLHEFEEILSVELEAYQTNYQGEKTYTLKNTFSLVEDDCAIIIQQHSVSGEDNNFKLQQDIYLFEEENNTFVKSNLDS